MSLNKVECWKDSRAIVWGGSIGSLEAAFVQCFFPCLAGFFLAAASMRAELEAMSGRGVKEVLKSNGFGLL